MPKYLLGVLLAAIAVFAIAQPQTAAASDSEIELFIGKTHRPGSQTPPAGTGEPALTLFPVAFDVWRQQIDAAPEVLSAGVHPDASAAFQFVGGPLDGATRSTLVDTPAGFTGDPNAVPTCSLDQFFEAETPDVSGGCTPENQIGVALVKTLLPMSNISPIYNLDPPRGAPAAFGFWTTNPNVPTVIVPSLRADENYSLRVKSEDTPSWAILHAATVTIWGWPHDPAHDAQRWNPASQRWGSVLSSRSRRPLVINPTECGTEPSITRLNVNTWVRPSHWLVAQDETDGPTVDCDSLSFSSANAPVSLAVEPTSRAIHSPTGLIAKLRLPFSSDASIPARPMLRDVEVELPEGLTVNAAAGDGLEGCRPEEIGLGNDASPRCPTGSNLGRVRVKTPLLAEELTGSVYQAMPYDNPFASLLALYVVVSSEERGIRVKLAGEVKVDPQTGRATSTFLNNPQLPFTELDLELKSGPRAPLASPAACGTTEAISTLTPWSHPHSGPPVVHRDSLDFESSASGACPYGALGFSPGFSAGGDSAVAGGPSTFAMAISRRDGEQEISSIADVRLPEGLLARVRDADLCPDADADRGVCPAGSDIGRVEVAAGVGSAPLWVPQLGKARTSVSLTGPYRGAPYGLSIVVPAQAGPFDLGKVVVRSALHVDERTTQVSSGVDESRIFDREGRLVEVMQGRVPRILEGIVLNQREIRVLVDRPGFMVNPTNCSAQSVSATVGSYGGAGHNLSDRFQVGECASLGFAPRFRARILDRGRRSTLRSWNPRTRFTVVPRPGDANIGGARVALPSSTILDQSNLDTTCTRAQMAAEDCPAGSIVGYAKAWSPLLRRPVEGPVYLAANGGVRPLPDIIAVLDGEVRVSLLGEISTLRTRGRARLQNTFRVVPDAR